MTAWWILGSSAILIARYFKPLFPRQKLCGTAVWFQLHRDLNVIALVLQLLAVIFIYYQAGWVWYECSYLCTSDVSSLLQKCVFYPFRDSGFFQEDACDHGVLRYVSSFVAADLRVLPTLASLEVQDLLQLAALVRRNGGVGFCK